MSRVSASPLKEEIYRWIFAVLAFSSLIFLLGIMLTLIKDSLPVFKSVPFFSFVFGKSWYPTYDPPEFGILPLIAGSLWVSFGALCVCMPLGIGSALYIHEIAGPRQKSFLKPLIEILAGIPSVIYGFFGMAILSPFFKDLFHLPVGMCALTASVILGFMATPTVCSLAEDALNFVPSGFKEAAYALGANRWRTLTKVVVPAAGSGIFTAVILGMSRAIGETMTVLMVAGGAAIIPKSFLDPVRPMTSTIAAEMGEAVTGSPHYAALFAIGLVLFCITLLFNILAEVISNRFRIRLGGGL